MGIFKSNSMFQSYTKIDNGGITYIVYADLRNVGEFLEKEDIIVAFILPSSKGQLHYSILHLWTQLALKVNYLVNVSSSETYINLCRNKLIDSANEVCARQLNKLPDYYLFLDDDSVVHPSLFDALRKKLDDHKIGVVTADYIRKVDWRPTWTPVDYYTKWKQKWRFRRGDLVEVVTAGAGALLVKGEVLRKIKPPWFKVVSDAKTFLGEDAYFCQLCRDNGYKVYVATDVIIGHLGAIVFPQDWEDTGRKVRKASDTRYL